MAFKEKTFLTVEIQKRKILWKTHAKQDSRICDPVRRAKEKVKKKKETAFFRVLIW